MFRFSSAFKVMLTLQSIYESSQWHYGKEPVCQCRRHKRRAFNPRVGKIPCRRAWQPTPVFVPGESHGQRSLAGYSHRVAWNRTGLKWLSTHTRGELTVVLRGGWGIFVMPLCTLLWMWAHRYRHSIKLHTTTYIHTRVRAWNTGAIWKLIGVLTFHLWEQELGCYQPPSAIFLEFPEDVSCASIKGPFIFSLFPAPVMEISCFWKLWFITPHYC